ncbi:uncharacterized protein BDR25DRAFT_356848 [Lindgomyces ingoldianus]|uniref:Uncharacterized protein n=1 Tax=Lindgomyces ingoldianus TaxID=673940 RepID=A0ACB6QQ85_9PLEO|nr:uncharacterized protein BDR25DRAFT_356848 [Lindgomyces ingoldianus]KAF2469081.1 hypothetical protein BDR25DRAFT_356848 [Lindgomyces ingoldianus]
MSGIWGGYRDMYSKLGHHNGQKNNVDGIVAEFVRRLLTKQAITAFSALISEHEPPGPQQPAFNRPKPPKILYNYRKRVLHPPALRKPKLYSPRSSPLVLPSNVGLNTCGSVSYGRLLVKFPSVFSPSNSFSVSRSLKKGAQITFGIQSLTKPYQIA